MQFVQERPHVNTFRFHANEKVCYNKETHSGRRIFLEEFAWFHFYFQSSSWPSRRDIGISYNYCVKSVALGSDLNISQAPENFVNFRITETT